MKISVTLCSLLFVSFSLFAQKDVKSLVREGIKLHDTGNYEEAIKKYEEAAKIEPKSTLVNYEMANTYIAMSDFKKAVKFADKVIDVKGDNLDEAYMLKGTALDMDGKPKDAIKAYKDGIKANPNSYLLNFNLGITLSGLKELKEAEPYYLEAIRLKPSHASSHLQLGNIGMAFDSKTKGLLSYYFYLLLDPNNKFSKLAYENIKKLMPDAESLKDKNNPNSFNISISQSGDSEVSSLDLLLSMMSLTETMMDSSSLKIEGAKKAEDSAATRKIMNKIAPKNTFDAFAKRNDSFFKSIGEMNDKKKGKHSFWWHFYAEFFADLQKNGHTEAFSFYISQPSKDKYVKDWLKGNREKVEKFTAWVGAYKFPEK